MKNSVMLFLAVLLGIQAVSYAEPVSKEAVDALKGLIEMSKDLNSATKMQEKECIKAFPSQKFCYCLFENMTVYTGFHEYLAVVRAGKLQFENLSMTTMDKNMVAMIFSAREKCATHIK